MEDKYRVENPFGGLGESSKPWPLPLFVLSLNLLTSIRTFFDSGRRFIPLRRRRFGGLVLYIANNAKSLVVWSSDALMV